MVYFNADDVPREDLQTILRLNLFRKVFFAYSSLFILNAFGCHFCPRPLPCVREKKSSSYPFCFCRLDCPCSVSNDQEIIFITNFCEPIEILSAALRNTCSHSDWMFFYMWIIESNDQQNSGWKWRLKVEKVDGPSKVSGPAENGRPWVKVDSLLMDSRPSTFP